MSKSSEATWINQHDRQALSLVKQLTLERAYIRFDRQFKIVFVVLLNYWGTLKPHSVDWTIDIKYLTLKWPQRINQVSFC